MAYIKILFVSLLLYGSFTLYTNPGTWLFIQNANLIFHEAGHMLFMFFGDFVSILGGSLTELLIPLLVTLHFLWYKKLFAAGFGLWWLSTALHSVGVYAGDARSQLLPLLGGESVIHDWTYILASLRLLRYDHVIENVFLSLSVVTLLGACYFFYRAITQKNVTFIPPIKFKRQ